MPVTMLFEDREGTLWLGSEGGGLGQASPAVVRGLVPPGPGQNNVDTVSEDGAGRMWIRTAGGSLLFEHGAFSMLRSQSWWPRFAETTMRPDVDGSMLVGGLSGLYRVWPDRRFEQLLASPIGDVADFLRDRRGVVWLATTVGLLRSSAATWTKVPALPFEDIKVLRESRDGAIWAGAYGGLARVAGDQVQAWTAADGLSSDRIRALHEDDRGALWIGTYDGGLMRFADGKFVSILKRDGLFDNGAFTVLDGGDGRYYMCSNRGLYSVAIRELEAFASGAVRSVTSRGLSQRRRHAVVRMQRRPSTVRLAARGRHALVPDPGRYRRGRSTCDHGKHRARLRLSSKRSRPNIGRFRPTIRLIWLRANGGWRCGTRPARSSGPRPSGSVISS
jgi:ligand-binding sensor domain-containing protein